MASVTATGPVTVQAGTANRAIQRRTLSEIQRRCRCTKCGWRRADLRADYSEQQAALYGGGWMMPPG